VELPICIIGDAARNLSRFYKNLNAERSHGSLTDGAIDVFVFRFFPYVLLETGFGTCCVGRVEGVRAEMSCKKILL
jgi:hypothetical protein